jgi:hypothetical protein
VLPLAVVSCLLQLKYENLPDSRAGGEVDGGSLRPIAVVANPKPNPDPEPEPDPDPKPN